jgi:hypothetical protein
MGDKISIPGRGREVLSSPRIRNDFGAHLISYAMETGNSFTGVKAAVA